MKQGWEIKKLGEVCEKIFAGGDKPKRFSETPSEDMNVPVYANGVAKEGLCGYTDKSVVKQDCVTVSARGTIGFCCVRTTPFVPIVRLITIIPSDCIAIRYLYYVINNANIENNGVSIPQLTVPMIKQISIPVPPLPEQEKIVAELDCLSGIIEKKRQQLKELDALAQSIFYEMFGNPVENERGWEVKSIKEIGKVITGNTPSRSVSEYYNSKDIEWIKTDNIESGKIHPTIAKEYLSKDGMMKGRVVECGAILVTCIAGSIASIGGCCIADRKVAFNQQINAVVPIGDINSLFLYYCLILSKRLIQDSASNGMKHLISKSNFEQIPLPLPPLPLQQSFAQKIEAIEQQKAFIKQSVAEVETLFNARMQEYFE